MNNPDETTEYTDEAIEWLAGEAEQTDAEYEALAAELGAL